MIDKCREHAAHRLHVDAGIVNVKYEGQRTDGTHAVNGDAETNPVVTFQCNFGPAGRHITELVVNEAQTCPVDVTEADRYKYPACR